MNLDPDEYITLDYYDRNAAEWAAGHDAPGFWSDELVQFRNLLPAGQVLEIGFGSGRDAEALERTYDYLDVDVSAGFLVEARKRHPGIDFRLVQSIYALEFPPGSFDGFWAAASLLHVPKRRIETALRSIGACLRPGAIGFISLKEGDGEGLVDEREGGIRFFAYYRLEEFAEILSGAGYAVLKAYSRTGDAAVWLTYFVRKS